MEFVRVFNKLNRNDASIAGGKGASLGEMSSAKIPVPEGYVILSDAFEHFIEKTDLNVEIDSILHKVNHENIQTVENASEKIKALIMGAEIPKEISALINIEFDKLSAKYVAVRSSATAEDSSSAAWAGQLESYLNTTKEELLLNVKKCWASLFTPRAIFYRFEKGLGKEKISVAVVVQKMVESEISGIAFSVHPVTQDYNQIIIEAGYGLGEAIVSGQITPDSYVIEKKERKIIDKNISVQEKGIYRIEGGGNEWKNINSDKKGKQKISDEQILDLSKIIIQIENHYGFPCDIEWAFEKGKFYIVQSRPITTLTEKGDIKKQEENKIISKYSIPTDYLFRKTVSFPRVPIIVLYAFRGFINNPLLKDVKNWKMNNICIVDDHYEDWQDHSKKTIIKDDKIISKIISYGRECIKKYKKELENIINQNKKYSNAELLEIYNKLNKIYLDIYYPNILLNDECFETKNSKLLEELPKIRADISEKLVTAAWSAYDKIIYNAAQNIKINPEILQRVTWEEMISILKGKIKSGDIANIKDREVGFIHFDNELKLVFGKEALELKRYLHENDPQQKDINYSKEKGIIKGITANKGKVKGEVVILHAKDYPNASKILSGKKNYILVTPMTRPEISQYFKDARGFVADEGGITSHLSIVARELNKPAVMGTGFATRILKEGDMVEVDADKGIVRILKRNEEEKYNLLSEEFLKNVGDEKVFEFQGDFIILYVGIDWLNYYDKDMNKHNIYPAMLFKEGKMSKMYVSDSKYAYCAEYTLRQFLNRDFPFEKMQKIYKNAESRIVKDYDSYYKSKKHGNANELIEKISKSYDYLHELIASSLAIERLDKDIVKKVLSELKLKIDLEKVWEIAHIQDFPSFESNNKKNIIKAIENKTNPEEIQYIYNNYIFFPNKSFICEELKKLDVSKTKKEIDEFESHLESKRKEFIERSKALNLDEKLLLNYLKWTMQTRDTRKELINKAEVYQYNLIRELYLMLGLDESLVPLTKIDEIVKGKDYILKNKENIEKRKDKLGLLWFTKNNYREFYGDFSKDLEIMTERVKKDHAQEESSLVGEIGCKGNVKGKVKIILSQDEFKDFREGDILVTSMTRPEFVPIMKKAAGIITNEGGITSHAAIVSRELKIPCIIGTKIATKILKDGDLVEVDADNGIVKILGKADNNTISFRELVHLDTPLSLVELHYEQEAASKLPWTKNKFDIKPYIIYERKNNQTYFYYNPLGIEWQQREAGAFKDEELAIRKIKEGYDKIKEIIEGEKALSRNEFLNFLKDVRSLWPWLNYMWWAIEFREKNSQPYEKLISIRKYTERFSSGIIAVLRKSLEKIYPKLKEFSNFILLSEVEKDNLPSIEVLRNRSKSYAYANGTLFSSIDEIKDFKFDIEKHLESNELTGQSAYPGKIKGKIRIIRRREDVSKFNKGEILLASTTTPDYLPAMKKAGAIISEHGGVICHAAISSRELKIPCVVGVKGAINSLDNGDIVEVDADKGIVRIIKKN